MLSSVDFSARGAGRADRQLREDRLSISALIENSAYSGQYGFYGERFLDEINPVIKHSMVNDYSIGISGHIQNPQHGVDNRQLLIQFLAVHIWASPHP